MFVLHVLSQNCVIMVKHDLVIEQLFELSGSEIVELEVEIECSQSISSGLVLGAVELRQIRVLQSI